MTTPFNEVPPSTVRFRRVAPNRWIVPRLDYALEYLPESGNYAFYRSGKVLFTVETLSEADESLADCLGCR